MGRTLRADIIVGGKADASFYALGNTLAAMGQAVNQISEKLIQFGKESVDAFVSYEDAMLDAEVALRTQYTSSVELARVMQQLDKAAMQWASNSRFTTEDVAGAISNAAHAGWDLEKMLLGVPAAMKIANAGQMNLEQSLEYLVDISNAAGIEFDQLGLMVDYWAFAANSSSTTIEEMGQAMQKMGATMQFVKGDMAGLTTMLAALSNNGTKGTEAGTLLRNAFIRMIAPTKKAAEAMDSLVLSSEDLNDIYVNSDGLENATKLLKEAGFSAYDGQGKLKSFMTIWAELDKATKGMTEEDRNNVLTAIFPTRTITGALALLEAAASGWAGLYESIQANGEGYAEYASDTMMSGLGGALMRLESAYNVLQTKTGKSLADDVARVAGDLKDMIDSINSMDGTLFDSIVGGLEAVAVAGPGLMAAGAAFKFIGVAMGAAGPAAAIGIWATALTAVAAGIEKFNEAMYNAQFGDMGLDTDMLQGYFSGLNEAFAQGTEPITKYNEALAKATENYELASTTLSSKLLTSMITGLTITPEQQAQMLTLGDQLGEALLAGIEYNFSSSEEGLAYLTGKTIEELGEDDGYAGRIMDLLDAGFASSTEKAEGLSKKLRDALTAGFGDGHLSEEEAANIRAIFNEIDALAAENLRMEQEAQTEADRYNLLRKARSLGIDGLGELTQMSDSQLESQYAAIDAIYDEIVKNTIKAAKQEGVEWEDDLADLDAQRASAKAQARAEQSAALIKAYMAAGADSDLSNPLSYAMQIAEGLLYGSYGEDTAHDLFRREYGNNRYAGEFNPGADTTATQLGKFLAMTVDAPGGQAELARQISYLDGVGSTEQAEQLRMLYLAEQIVNGYEKTGVSQNGAVASSAQGHFGKGSEYDATRRGIIEQYQDANVFQMSAAEAATAIAKNPGIQALMTDIGLAAAGAQVDLMSTYEALSASESVVLSNILNGLFASYDMDALRDGSTLSNGIFKDIYGMYRLLNDKTVNAESYSLSGGQTTGGTEVITAEADTEAADTALDQVAGKRRTAPIMARANTAAAAAALDALRKPFGTDVYVRMHIGGAALGGTGFGGTHFDTGQFAALSNLYADGGRADEASIFGEAGPEWAIPEQHSQRTAELLDAARKASGFTWPELIGRTAGTDRSSGGNYTLVYSPVIHSGNADGVENALLKDKERLEKWWREKRLLDETEEYS